MKKILLLVLVIASAFLCACHYGASDAQGEALTGYGYDAFTEFAESNPYDAEYNQILKTDECSISEAAANWLKNWNDEFAYTVAAAEPLFDSADDYDKWESAMLASLESTNDLYKAQYDCAITEHIGQMQFHEIKIKHVHAVRDLTLNAKFFCYILEKEKGVADKDMISIRWYRK